ncbi:Cytochrome P450 protein, partial [Operophtera brumata]
MTTPNDQSSKYDKTKHIVIHDYQQILSIPLSLNFFYANARSIMTPGKFDELQCILKAIPTTTHLILLTETWIQSESDAKLQQLTGYTHYYNFRDDSRGGGVSIFIHNSLDHKLTEEKYTDGNHFLWILLKKISLNIGLIYKPGRTNFNKFSKTFEQQLEQRKRSIVFGDFNIDFLKNCPYVSQHMTVLEELGFCILNKIEESHCTRHSKIRKSIIDHIYTDLLEENFNFFIIESAMSDHKHIYLELIKRIPTNKEKIKYDAVDYDKLYKCIKELDLKSEHHNYSNLEQNIKMCIKESTITKTKRVNLPKDDWINKDIIAGINTRNTYWRKLKKDPKNKNKLNDFIRERNRDLTTRYANDVIASCAFGVKVDSHTDEDNEFYVMGRNTANFGLKRILTYFGYCASPAIMKKLNIKLFEDDIKNFFKSLVMSNMKEREDRAILRPDMIHLLMEAKKGALKHDNTETKDADAGFSTVEESDIGKMTVNRTWSDEDLVSQAFLFFLAGFETVSSTMSFLLHELAVNPDVQERLVQEIRENDEKSGGKFDYSSIQNMTYMDMVVSGKAVWHILIKLYCRVNEGYEVLRLWPPVSGLGRICLKDYNLGKPYEKAQSDFIVRKGESVAIPVWAIHRDPAYFPDPERFDPERFSEQNKHSIKPFTYMPFGSGPRNCIGNNFSEDFPPSLSNRASCVHYNEPARKVYFL